MSGGPSSVGGTANEAGSFRRLPPPHATPIAAQPVPAVGNAIPPKIAIAAARTPAAVPAMPATPPVVPATPPMMPAAPVPSAMADLLGGDAGFDSGRTRHRFGETRGGRQRRADDTGERQRQGNLLDFRDHEVFLFSGWSRRPADVGSSDACSGPPLWSCTRKVPRE